MDAKPQASQHLWQRVVLQALRDAIVPRKRPDAEAQSARLSAVNWFNAAGPDFHEVCSLAGFDSDMISNWWRAARRDPEKMQAALLRFHEAPKFKEVSKNE